MLGCVDRLAHLSNGVSSVHAGFRKLTRPLPENALPPLLVMALTTPPVKRPYSAEMPEVSTCVSSIASSMNRFCGVREQVVVDVDAVDHEDVVEGEARR